jgi:hypothetical protein
MMEAQPMRWVNASRLLARTAIHGRTAMQGRAGVVFVLVLNAVVMTGGGRDVRADVIPSSYKLVDLGEKPAGAGFYSVSINQVGDTIPSWERETGDYKLSWILDPVVPGRAIEGVVHRTGSDTNLLSDLLKDVTKVSLQGVNSVGDVVGTYQDVTKGSFFYSTTTDQLINLKSLPGADGSAVVYDINKFGQIVGEQGGHAILYASPTAVPINLDTLLPPGSNWELLKATGINDRGEIVGPGGIRNEYSGYYKLEPDTAQVPEPTTLMVWLGAGLAIVCTRSFRRRTH